MNVVATAKPGYRFVNWTEGGNQVAGNPLARYTFTASADRTLVANFAPLAGLLTYKMKFFGGSPTPPFGYFTYDTPKQLFTAFHVTWNGADIHLLPNANTPVTQGSTFPPFSNQQFYELLISDGHYNGADFAKIWAVYPPNPPGNFFTLQLALHLFTSNNQGLLTGANYPAPAFVATYTSGTSR